MMMHAGRRLTTRSYLIQAARELIAEEPLGEITSAQIATRAGVGNGTFYLYFRDKSEVAMAVVDVCVDLLREALGQADSPSLDGQLRRLFAFLHEERAAARILFTPGLLGPAECSAIRDRAAGISLPRSGIGAGVEGALRNEAIRAVIWMWAAHVLASGASPDDADRWVPALQRILAPLLAGSPRQDVDCFNPSLWREPCGS